MWNIVILDLAWRELWFKAFDLIIFQYFIFFIYFHFYFYFHY